MGVKCGPVPVDDLTGIVEQPAQFDTYGAAAFILAFLSHRLGTASFSNGKEQFDGITIDHGKETRFGQ